MPADGTPSAASPLDFGELWERVNPCVVSDALLARLVHDAEVEAGAGDGPDECVLPLGTYNDGVLAAGGSMFDRWIPVVQVKGRAARG